MFKELIRSAEKMAAAAFMKSGLSTHVPIGRASMLVKHSRPQDFIKDSATGLMIPDPRSFKLVDEPELVWNLITNAGRDFLHVQGYNTTGLGANGLNYVGLSNDAVTETAVSTVLTNEITLNGLGRVQGTYAHTGGTNTTTVDKTFTATGSQSAQKAALFTAVSAGTMNHVLGFTQRALISGDTLQVTFTITLG
jgi:hypothetical protein